MAYNVEMFPSSATANQHTIVWTEHALLQALQSNIRGAAVVTSTVRAARALRQYYDQWQRASGNAGWMTPQILVWEAWLQTHWDAAILSGTETRVLLTEVQELELWRKVLAQDEAARRTLSIEALAELVQRAWKQMHQYRIPLARLHGDISVDAKAFSAWAAEFEKLCRQSSFLSSALIEAAIAQSIPSQELSFPKQLFLLGFDRATPAQTMLIDALPARGCSAHFVELRPIEDVNGDRTIVCAGTQEEEIASAAHWVRRSLLETPSRRIAVIVPSLKEMRGAIDRAFRRVLAPSSMDIRAQSISLPYEFSLGTAMVRLPQIRTALTLLRWLQGSIPAEQISWLLVHGSFSGSPNEPAASESARARLDRRFRDREFQLGGPVSLSSFVQWLSQSGSREESAALRRLIERLFVVAQRYGLEKALSYSDWSEIIEDLLVTAEWHLPTASSSAEYQLLRRWNTLLDDLSSLSSVAGPVRFAAGIEKLDHLAAHTLFTLETSNAPVHILGVSESAGLVFDAVWWMNAQASIWPPRGKAQPFLPWSLQREAHMPYADPAEDSTFALKTTKRILNSTKTAVVSFALQESDPANSSAHISDREILLSPLVRAALPGISIIDMDAFVPQPGRNHVMLESNLEIIREEAAVPFQGTQVRGGVRFLKLHAACPFRAFAELRLDARPLTESDTGLSPDAQGTIIHRVLERFWNQMESQKNLLASTAVQLRENLREHIHNVLAEFLQHANEPWQRSLLQIESERLEQRLLAWLEQEKQRPDFTVFKTENILDSPRLGKIEFQCRVDRIDRVEQGIVLLDYKTGVVDRGWCEGDRPDQPQLPAYAVLRSKTLAAEDALAGVAFAGLHPRKIGFTVVGSRPSTFSTSSESANADAEISSEERTSSKSNPASLTAEEMQSRQQAWNVTLTRLAEEFRAGVVIVDPKNHGETCKYCAQSLLCRIRETMGVSSSMERLEP